MLSHRLDKGMWNQVFAVPSAVVDRHVRLCGEVALKVLLLLLRHEQYLSEEEIARCIGGKTAVQDVRDALEYWIQAGVIVGDGAAASGQPTAPPELKPEEAPEPPRPLLEAMRPPLVLLAGEAAREPDRPVARPSFASGAGEKGVEQDPALATVLRYIRETQGQPEAREEERQVQTISQKRMRLHAEDINHMAKDDENIGFLLQESQQVLGRTLSAVDTETVVALYAYYQMAPDLALMLLQYCAAMEKDSMYYVEKVAADWKERGIDTHERAETEILGAAKRGSVEGRIKTAFGIYDRKLVAAEQKYIRSWTEEMGFDLEVIIAAFERAVEQKGKLSFSYINGILKKWREKGVVTVEQALTETRDRPGPSGPQASGRVASYDIGELERMIHSGRVTE